MDPTSDAALVHKHNEWERQMETADARQMELHHFQWNLVKEQLKSMAEDFAKLKREYSDMRGTFDKEFGPQVRECRVTVQNEVRERSSMQERVDKRLSDLRELITHEVARVAGDVNARTLELRELVSESTSREKTLRDQHFSAVQEHLTLDRRLRDEERREMAASLERCEESVRSQVAQQQLELQGEVMGFGEHLAEHRNQIEQSLTGEKLAREEHRGALLTSLEALEALKDDVDRKASAADVEDLRAMLSINRAQAKLVATARQPAPLATSPVEPATPPALAVPPAQAMPAMMPATMPAAPTIHAPFVPAPMHSSPVMTTPVTPARAAIPVPMTTVPPHTFAHPTAVPTTTVHPTLVQTTTVPSHTPMVISPPGVATPGGSRRREATPPPPRPVSTPGPPIVPLRTTDGLCRTMGSIGGSHSHASLAGSISMPPTHTPPAPAFAGAVREAAHALGPVAARTGSATPPPPGMQQMHAPCLRMPSGTPSLGCNR